MSCFFLFQKYIILNNFDDNLEIPLQAWKCHFSRETSDCYHNYVSKTMKMSFRISLSSFALNIR